MTTVIDQTILRNSLLFKDVSNEVLQQVGKHCTPMDLNAGETLFEQDSPSDAMYFLVEGQIHIIRQYPDGYDVILATENPYYVIGELSMLANLPRTGAVVAVSDCDLVKLSRDAIISICEAMPEIAVQAITILGQRLYQLNLRVREQAIGNVAARVATALLMLAREQTGDIEGEVSVAQLARTTAIDRDVVDHMLKDWDMEGIIRRSGRQIAIVNLEKLVNIAG
ncbi:MAG: Crp/Fnr family transcriptional regulator [Chloroflexi bacterium]|nr:Crp/Fnr family transcriptional regulator [Chloroflexota bacterium]